MKNFKKNENNPIFGSGEIGTAFDVYVTREENRYRMDFSWRKKKACAVTFSDDGIHWSEPQITLSYDESTGWEDDINRNCVLKIDGVYKMWYTGQARGYSYIGYAESSDGIHFERKCAEPIMISEYPWEGESVMNPCVLYENGEYRMWYSAGETYEPNVLAYATSKDGIHWNKIRFNPIFVCDPNNTYEQERVGGCQVIKVEDEYYIFYIGYENIDTARICVAKSKDGIIGWEKSSLNPIVSPDAGMWDAEACYKPSVIWNEEEQKWMLWYNGRNGTDEFIGLAEIDRKDLFV
ncbi:MAG: hypothetical protein U0L92_05495 [Clostridia bacterium]|nr:hypothetical protein [Clostridia bacterium]